MAKEDDKIRAEGLVIEALPGTQFRVKLDNGHEVLAYLSGKMRKHYIRILLGDRVAMEMSPYDLTAPALLFVSARTRLLRPNKFAIYIVIEIKRLSIFESLFCILLTYCYGRSLKEPSTFI